MAEEGNLERIEILEAASTLLSLRRHFDERIRWQRARNSFFASHPPILNPFGYGQMWPFYKPFPYDVTTLPMLHQSPFPFQVSPYVFGARPPWFPVPQSSFASPLSNRNTESSLPESLPSTPISATPPRMSLMPVAMETTEGSFHEDNDDNGEQDDSSTVTSDKYDQKRKRRNLTKSQQEILEKAYHTTKYPHIDERLKLSRATQLTEDRIQIWFQNRRAKDRRMTDVMKSPSQKPSELENNETWNQEDGLVCVKVEGGVAREVLPSLLYEEDEYVEPSPKRIKQEQ